MIMTRSTLIHNAQAKPTGMSDDLLRANQEEKDGEDLCIYPVRQVVEVTGRERFKE